VSQDGSRIITPSMRGTISAPAVPGSLRHQLIQQMEKLGYTHSLEPGVIALEQGTGHPGEGYQTGAQRYVMALGITRVIEDEDMREEAYCDVFTKGMVEVPISPSRRAELRAQARQEGMTVSTVYLPSGQRPEDDATVMRYSRPTTEVVIQDGVAVRAWDTYAMIWEQGFSPADPNNRAPDADPESWAYADVEEHSAAPAPSAAPRRSPPAGRAQHPSRTTAFKRHPLSRRA
jgi:hypothetical protein